MPYTFHPFPIVRAMKNAVTTILILVLIALFRENLGTLDVPLVFVVLAFGVISIVSTFALANTFSITLGDSAIIYRFGVLTRTEYTLPYSKITEARFFQGVMDQFLGLGTLTIDTAGYTDIPLHIPEIRLKDIRRSIDAINATAPKPI